MTTIGDTLNFKLSTDVRGNTLDVLSKARRHEPGVYVRTYDIGGEQVNRLDLTADEALDLAQALIFAARTSQQFTAGLNKLNTPEAAPVAPEAAPEADWTCPDCGRGVIGSSDADLDWQVDNHVASCVGVPGVTSDRVTVIQAIDAFLAVTNSGDHPQGYSFVADTPGSKNTRIVMVDAHGGRSVHCFIDNHTGDVYKSAGWKAPAKGVRGNIVTGLADVAARWNWAGGWLYLR